MSAWARGKVLAGEEHGGVVFGTTGMQPASGPMPAHSLATRFRRITRYASFSSSVGCDERGAGRMHAPGIGTHNSHPQSAHACTQGMSMPALGTRSILCVRRLLAAYTTPPPCMDAGRWEQGDVYLMQGSAHGWFLLCLVDDCCPHCTPPPHAWTEAVWPHAWTGRSAHAPTWSCAPGGCLLPAPYSPRSSALIVSARRSRGSAAGGPRVGNSGGGPGPCFMTQRLRCMPAV